MRRFIYALLALLVPAFALAQLNPGGGLNPVPQFVTLTNSIAGNVSLNNTGLFFDGPVVAQGTTGRFWASGTISLVDTGAVATHNAKLWDGTTVIASGRCTSPAAGQYCVIALSGSITNPAGNIRISAQDVSTVAGLIAANASGGGKDSTITVYGY